MGSRPQDRACYLTEQRRGTLAASGVCWPPGDTAQSPAAQRTEVAVPGTMVPFRRDAAEMSSKGF